MTSICQRIGSCLPRLTVENIERVVVGGMGGVACCVGGIPLVLATVGLYLCGKRYVMPVSAREPQPQINQRPVAPSLLQDHKVSSVSSSLRLDDSARLFRPAGTPAAIIWEGNSCFCSSPLWTLFTNEPAVLGELPEAIGRKVNERRLFPGGIDSICGIGSEQTNALIAIAPILRKKEPLVLADFNVLRQSLQQLERFEFPEGSNKRELKALLSLLELHDLIRDFQTKSSVSGAQVNSLREMVFRVNSNFKDRGSRIGDAHEVFQTLANLIFEGSNFEQNLRTTRTGQGQNLVENRVNWGDILLPMPREAGQTLKSCLEEYLAPKKGVRLELGYPRKAYTLKEETRFETAPPFLALTLNRGELLIPDDFKGADLDIPEFGAPKMNMSPVGVEDRLELGSRFFQDGRKGAYQLVGVSRHMGNFAHYDGVLKRPDGTWYYCNDLNEQKSVYEFNASEVPETAKTGYMFFYRRIPG